MLVVCGSLPGGGRLYLMDGAIRVVVAVEPLRSEGDFS